MEMSFRFWSPAPLAMGTELSSPRTRVFHPKSQRSLGPGGRQLVVTAKPQHQSLISYIKEKKMEVANVEHTLLPPVLTKRNLTWAILRKYVNIGTDVERNLPSKLP